MSEQSRRKLSRIMKAVEEYVYIRKSADTSYPIGSPDWIEMVRDCSVSRIKLKEIIFKEIIGEKK